MNGLEILSKTEIFERNNAIIYASLIVLVIGIVSCFIVRGAKTRKKRTIFIRIIVLSIIIGGALGIIGSRKNVPTGRYQYEAVIDDSVSYLDLTEKYDIISSNDNEILIEIKNPVTNDTEILTGDIEGTTLYENSVDENTTQYQSDFIECSVVRVKDGDTIVVELDGEEITVRMIGVNTPESVHPDADKNTNEGTLASDFTKNYLTSGMQVYLEYDEDMYDKYDRTLAYVWLSNEVDTDNFEDFCQYNYGAILLQNTYCEAVYYAPNGKYKEWYEILDNEY